MTVADRFVVGVVKIGKRHKQKDGLEYLNQKHKSKLGTRLDHEGHKLNKATENENCRSKGYRTAESNFFVLSGWSMVERQKLM
jgi:hypothetical protein